MNILERWALGLALNRLEARMGAGWKGKAGGLGLILAGVAGLLNDFAAGTITAEKAIAYFGMCAAGLGVFGIRAALPG